MKKILGLIFGFFIISCTPRMLINDIEKGDIMMRTMNGNYSVVQFDSMCVADTLPNDFSLWQNVWLKDYETGDKVTLYLYIKEYGKKEFVYEVEKTSDDSVKIIKRVIVE